jgi:hypothetical protein
MPNFLNVAILLIVLIADDYIPYEVTLSGTNAK